MVKNDIAARAVPDAHEYSALNPLDRELRGAVATAADVLRGDRGRELMAELVAQHMPQGGDGGMQHEVPQLAAPDRQIDPAAIEALAARLSEITPQAQAEAAQAALQVLNADQEEQQNAIQQYEQALDEEAAAMQRLDTWKGAYLARRQALAEAEARLAEEGDGDGSKAEQIAGLRQDLLVAQEEGHEMLQAVLAAREAVNLHFLRLNQEAVNLPVETVRRDMHGLRDLLRQLASISELLEKLGAQRATNQREFLVAQQEARIRKMTEDAEKSRAMQEKAALINSIMGAVGKVLGVTVMVFGLLGSMFSGPVGLAVAAVGLGLVLADEAVRGATGESFLEKALAPLLNVVQEALAPMIRGLGRALESLGLDSTTAMIVAATMAAAVMIVAVVALSLSGVGSALARGAGYVFQGVTRATTRVLEKLVSQLLPNLLKEKLARVVSLVSTEFSRLMEQVMKRMGMPHDVIAREAHARRMNVATIAVGGVHSAVVSAGGAVEGAHQVEQAKVMASMKLSDSELELIADQIGRLLQKFQSSYEDAQDYLMRASDVIRKHVDTGQALTRGIRRAAAL